MKALCLTSHYIAQVSESLLFSKMQTSNCRLDLTSLSTCDVNIPLVIRSSEQQIKPYDPSRGEISPSSKSSQTGCSPAAHANDPDPGSPTRPQESVNTIQALKSKPSISAEPRREKPGETQRSTKRVRRTWGYRYTHCVQQQPSDTKWMLNPPELYEMKFANLLKLIYT